MKPLKFVEQFAMLRYLARWLLLSCALGALAGTASAVFLYALDRATDERIHHLWLLWLLPVAGFATGWVYHRLGKSVEGGNNLLIDEIHDPQKMVPKRMAPMILIATVITHLFGGSEGREGTAVQMGGALASGFNGGELTPLFYIGATLGNALGHVLALPIPVLAGLGFVAVFAGAANTPIASTVMAIELFGLDIAIYAALSCVVAYLFSGHTGIYRAQRVGHAKHPLLPAGMRLSEMPALRRAGSSPSKPPSE